MSALKWLNHGNRDLPGDSRFFTPEERATEEWNAHFVDALTLIEGWKESEEIRPKTGSDDLGSVRIARRVGSARQTEGSRDDALSEFHGDALRNDKSQPVVYSAEEPMEIEGLVDRGAVREERKPCDVPVRESESENRRIKIRLVALPLRQGLAALPPCCEPVC